MHMIFAMVLYLFLMSQSHAMENPSTKIVNGTSLRELVFKEFPEITDKNPHIALPSWGLPVVTYNDSAFVQKFLELIGNTTTLLDQDKESILPTIAQSVQVKTGHWDICQRNDVCMSTGNVCECVVVVLQHKEAPLVAMYHYYQDADKYFKELDAFLSAIKEKAALASINIPDIKVSLISSYLSLNFLIIKRMLQERGFALGLFHVPPCAWLGAGDYVQAGKILIRLVCWCGLPQPH